MKTRLLSVLAVTAVASLCLSPALAKDAEKPVTHEARTSTCANEAKGLKGEERQQFMSQCLKGSVPSADTKATGKGAKGEHLAAQQNRMKTCNAEAGKKDLHGDERRKFMSTCLKG